MDVERLLIIVRFAKLMALAPNFNRKTRQIIYKKIEIAYQSLILILLLGTIILLLSYYVNITEDWKRYETLVFLVVNVLIYITLLHGMLGAVFFNLKHWNEVLKKLILVNDIFKILISKKKKFAKKLSISNLIIIFIWKHIPLTITIIADLKYNIGKSSGDEPLWFEMVLLIPCIFINFYIFLMNEFQVVVNKSLSKICDILKDDIIKNLNNDGYFLISKEIVDLKYTKKPKRETIVAKLIEIYLILNETVRIYNEIFGWGILFINITAITCILPGLEYTIRLIGPQKSCKPFPYPLYLSHLTYGIWQLILAGSLILSGNKSVGLIEEIVKLSFTGIRKTGNDNQKYEILIGDLELLAETVTVCKIRYSAGGVFPVDHSMFYVIFTSVTSYLIVLIQFILPTLQSECSVIKIEN